jgi:outer membrane cobalamin receptor
MKRDRKAIAKAVAAARWRCPASGKVAVAQEDAATPVMSEVVVTAARIEGGAPLDSRRLGAASIAPYRASTSDSARLLDALPGVSTYGAGGVSSLPVIRGLADDRIRIQVDGMDLISSCANHMNPPLSYIDPTNVDSIRLFAGVTPVSAGGDSIAGTIQVNSAPAEFAKAGEDIAAQRPGRCFLSQQRQRSRRQSLGDDRQRNAQPQLLRLDGAGRQLPGRGKVQAFGTVGWNLGMAFRR